MKKDYIEVVVNSTTKAYYKEKGLAAWIVCAKAAFSCGGFYKKRDGRMPAPLGVCRVLSVFRLV